MAHSRVTPTVVAAPIISTLLPIVAAPQGAATSRTVGTARPRPRGCRVETAAGESPPAIHGGRRANTTLAQYPHRLYAAHRQSTGTLRRDSTSLQGRAHLRRAAFRGGPRNWPPSPSWLRYLSRRGPTGYEPRLGTRPMCWVHHRQHDRPRPGAAGVRRAGPHPASAIPLVCEPAPQGCEPNRSLPRIGLEYVSRG